MAAPAPLLATKLFVPPLRPGLVPRPRLTMRLAEGLARPLTLLSAPAGFGKTTVLSEWHASEAFGLPQGNPLVMALPVFLSTLVLTGIAEEIGWRGFALPRLQGRFSALAVSLIVAALWAAWHNNPLNLPAIRATIPWHLATVLAMTVLMTWVYNSRGGSLLIAVLFHAFSNFSGWVIPTLPAALGGSTAALTAQTVIHLAVAVALVLRCGAAHLTRGSQRRVTR